MSSMSVHHLINKFSNQEKSMSFHHKSDLPESNYTAATDAASSRSSLRSSIASSNSPDYNPSVLRHNYQTPPQQNPGEHPMTPENASREAAAESAAHAPEAPDVVPEATLISLFGPEMKHLQISAPTLQTALQLRVEQERTKQEQIRLEIASRNLQIIELAAKNDVPPHLIPNMCVGNVPPPKPVVPGPNVSNNLTPSNRHRSHSGDSSQTPIHSSHSSLHGSPFFAHSNIVRNYDHSDNASLVPPASFRIGTGSSRFNQQTPNQHLRRPRSPAKIGAAAVASLASPVTPYVPTQRTLPLHQRHFSMPSEALPSSASERSQVKSNCQPPQMNIHPSTPVTSHGETSGKVSSMQVKPSPAQPLYKQTRNSQVPSQESMTSFQHVIQFHHWKPEDPGTEKPEVRNSNVQSLTPRQVFQHKRHKSNDMSVDLSSDPAIAEYRQTQPKIEDNEEDISMTTSDAAGESSSDYTEARRFSRSSNRGTVDILSTRGNS